MSTPAFDAEAFDADLARIRREWARVQPLIDWTEEHVGPALARP